MIYTALGPLKSNNATSNIALLFVYFVANDSDTLDRV
jgi:hypothetical protein